MELRFLESNFDISEDGSLKVSGYVNMTEQLSGVLSGKQKFREKISKGAFTRAIQNRTRGIDFLYEHDDDKILASTNNMSLNLTEDDKGLFMEASIAPTSYGKDAYTLIKSGILRNMSFGFSVIKDKWSRATDGILQRTVDELVLYEVSVVRNPAYSQSTIAARGIEITEDVDIPDNILQEEQEMEELRQALQDFSERFTKIEEEIKVLRDINVNVDALTKSVEELRSVKPSVEPEEEKVEEPEVKDSESSEPKVETEPEVEPEVETEPQTETEPEESSEEVEKPVETEDRSKEIEAELAEYASKIAAFKTKKEA